MHYLPHHAVHRDKTTTKLQIVYDTSAITGRPPLSDCLFPGPKISLCGPAAVEKAFLIVLVVNKLSGSCRLK